MGKSVSLVDPRPWSLSEVSSKSGLRFWVLNILNWLYHQAFWIFAGVVVGIVWMQFVQSWLANPASIWAPMIAMSAWFYLAGAHELSSTKYSLSAVFLAVALFVTAFVVQDQPTLLGGLSISHGILGRVILSGHRDLSPRFLSFWAGMHGIAGAILLI